MPRRSKHARRRDRARAEAQRWAALRARWPEWWQLPRVTFRVDAGPLIAACAAAERELQRIGAEFMGAFSRIAETATADLSRAAARADFADDVAEMRARLRDAMRGR